MPRAQESPEGRILRYFQQAPLDAATLVLGLAKDVLYHRGMVQAATVPASSAPHKPVVKKSHHKAKEDPPGATVHVKKSHHKKVNAGGGKRHQGNEAEVESFSLPDRA